MSNEDNIEEVQVASLDRYVIFAVISLIGGMGNCSQTALNAVMNQACATVGVGLETGQWLTTIYILALGIAVPLAPFVLKRFSEKTLVISSITMTIIGCLLMVFTQSFVLAFIARILQACGCGLLMPYMQTIIMTDLPRNRMGLFMGINGVAFGFSSNIGPTLAGFMDSVWGWQSFFWLYFFMCFVLLFPTIKNSKSHSKNQDYLRFDYKSYILCSAAFIALLLGISNASSFGLYSVLVWVPIIVGAVFLVIFVVSQLKLETPFISMEIFKNNEYVIGFIALCFLYIAFVGVMLVIPQYITVLRGGSSFDAGLVLLPAAAVALVANLFGGILMDMIGHRKVLLITGVCLAVGSVLVCFCSDSTPLVYLIVAQAIRTFGVSGSIGPLIGYSLSKLPAPIISDATAFSTLVRQSCASFGTSVMVLLITIINSGGVCALAYQAAFAFSAAASVACFLMIIFKVR
jgi:EmrB/QacA subfamily drug resistance transporter